ncbi:uncharacterized protein LOC142632390 [Castanea sativa]|uniref:uncharacterized protein LOC142632390 n=1 Tax=Castanea sativa TaxID=21020 RepID=UPI003F64F630
MIGGDKWLPDLHSSRVILPQKLFPNNTLVCALIDEEKCRWIEDRMLEEFLPHEAEITLRLPLSSTRAKDKLMWTATKNGCYSTKLAYRSSQMRQWPQYLVHQTRWHTGRSSWRLGILAQKIPRLTKLFAYIAWSIWHNRNAQRVGTTTLPLRNIYSDAVDRLQEFQMTQDSSLLQRTMAQPTHWLPPPPSQYKANCDGAIFQDTSSAGLGVVVRDSDGFVIKALSECIGLPPIVEDLEALACRRTISFAIKIGLQDVVFEGDFEVIYKHLISDSPCLAAFGQIIEDSRLLTSNLRNASFSHVKCNGNTVADKLAKLAKFFYEPQIWLEDIHCDATNFVTLDRSFLAS